LKAPSITDSLLIHYKHLYSTSSSGATQRRDETDDVSQVHVHYYSRKGLLLRL